MGWCDDAATLFYSSYNRFLINTLYINIEKILVSVLRSLYPTSLAVTTEMITIVLLLFIDNYSTSEYLELRNKGGCKPLH